MKSLLYLLTFLPLFGFSQEAVREQQIVSPIDEVKLYLTAGQMVHNQKIRLFSGRNKLIFSGISAYADPQSIQFVSNESSKFRLVSLSTEMDFMAAEAFNPRISVLKDSLEILRDEQQENSDIMDAYQAEKAVLNTNRDLGGENQNLSVEEIQKAATFYRVRTLEINKELSKLRKQQQKLNKLIEATRFQLVELNYVENQRSNQVVVLIDADGQVEFDASLKYLVSDCGWAATYDLSAVDLTQKINLKYKAQVYNNTGNEWKNVDLKLSTADPNLTASHPELSPWYLTYSSVAGGLKGKKKKYYAPQQVQQDYRQQAVTNLNWANERAYDNYYLEGQIEQKNMMEDNRFKLEQGKTRAVQTVQMRQIAISELSTEFEIANKFSCPSDAKPYLVDVKDVDLDATFSHITVPKLDKAAFLIANIVGWQELELIPGPTNVYFGGVYVGVSQIDTRNVSDTLSLSFGRDDKVTVLRKLKKEFSTKRVMGNTKKDSYLYEIAIRNNRNVPIRIEVFDQVPISRNNDITVSVDELSDGEKDEETGEVKWGLTVASGQVVGKEIGYTVKYPKNAKITVKRYRTVSAPSF